MHVITADDRPRCTRAAGPSGGVVARLAPSVVGFASNGDTFCTVGPVRMPAFSDVASGAAGGCESRQGVRYETRSRSLQCTSSSPFHSDRCLHRCNVGLVRSGRVSSHESSRHPGDARGLDGGRRRAGAAAAPHGCPGRDQRLRRPRGSDPDLRQSLRPADRGGLRLSASGPGRRGRHADRIPGPPDPGGDSPPE